MQGVAVLNHYFALFLEFGLLFLRGVVSGCVAYVFLDLVRFEFCLLVVGLSQVLVCANDMLWNLVLKATFKDSQSAMVGV